MDGFSVACRQLAGYMMGVVTAGAAIAKMDDWTNLNNRLRLVTNSQQELNKAMKDTFDIAQRSGAAWGGTAAIYQKIQYNSEKLGLSQAKVAQITESISKSISNSGSSAQAAGAALYQLGQAFDKSSLNGDEFVSMSENAGYLMEVFAKGLGVTRAELKEMSSAGELTTDKMIQAIEKMSGSIEEDFGKTNFTIGQSLTQLNNAATQFIGGAGEASGAASFLSSSIKGLADNLDSIAHIAVLGGVAMLTKAILTQSVAMKKGISDSIADRAAKTAQLESHVRLAALEVQRTRQVTALAATELNLARQERNSALTREARAAATIRLTQAEVAHRLALNQGTAALAAQTAAQNALNASRAVGTRLLGLVGGPIGALTIGVTALAAGYMYMQKRTEEASKKLEEQTQVAERTTEELLKLKGVEADVAKKDLEEAFEGQNKKLKELNYQFNAFVISVQNANKGNEEVAEISRKVRLGLISQADALEQLNSLNILTPEQKKQGLDFVNANIEQASTTVKVADKLKLYGNQVELNGNKATNASVGLDKYTEALNKNASAADKAAKAQKDYFDSLNQDVLSANERLAYMNLGFSKEVIDQINKLQKEKQKALGDGVTAIVTTEEINRIIQAQNILDKVKEKEGEIIDAKRKQNKENEKQYKYKQAEVELLRKAYGDVSKSGLGAYAESKGIPANVIAGLYMQESKAGTALKSRTGALGPWQTTTAYRDQHNIPLSKNNDFLFVGKIVVDAISDELKKSGSLKQAILSHNAGPTGSKQFLDTGKVNGSPDRNKEVAGYLPKIDKWASWGDGKKGDLLGSDDSGKAYQKFLDDQKKLEKEIKQLRERYSSEDIIRNQQRLDEIAEANRLGLQHLIPDIEKRYAAESKLAELSYSESLNGYQWSEQQKIVYARDRAQQELILSTQYSDKQKKVLKKAIDDQAKYELAVFDETQRRKAQELSDVLTERQKQSSNNQLRILAQANMSPDEFARWNLQNNMTNDISYAFDDYQKDVKGINRKDEAGRFEIEDANYRNQLLQQAERTHQARMLEIKEDYAAQAQDLAQSQHESQLQLYGSMLSQASSVWNDITNMVAESKDKNSKTYKTMFFVQKEMAIAQAVINTELAATKAMSEGGTIFGMSAATVIRAAGYAAVGVIAAQQFAGPTGDGYATGGHVRGPGTSTSDSIPAMLSDYEFVTKASAVKKIGVANMEYMNRTGEMPFQREYEELHKRIAGNQLPEPFIVSKYKDGGLVGSSRVQPDSYSQIYRERQLVEKRSPEAKQAKVTIINQTSQPVEATSQWDGDELKVILTEMRKQNEAMMDAKIEKRFRMANRQGWK
ncbi:tape measure protein [Acinetobacter piscicola]|uniref:Tape measure protein n=2 Tax=Acinetobacter TaxID=469 RepID=A0A7S6VVQ2_9GAMM|nr:tape measure protein [Acinetobacter piscicola]QOW45794.1 tape measure protein [Acinetobacter piscicola]